ncbi:MAG: hypothetical protein QX196_07505 [Methylococcaceae bacterium]
MFNHSLPRKLTGAAFVAAVLASGAATANSATADPFLGHTIDLQATGGQLMALPSTGPFGSTLYATDFFIDFFQTPDTISDGHGGIINTYNASFNVKFKQADGSAALIPGTTTQGEAVLHDGTFKVNFLNRPSPDATGTFDMKLLEATFSGTTNIGTNLFVNLANQPLANITIKPIDCAPGYCISYNQNFLHQGQYYNNLDGSGLPNPVPNLIDVSQFDVSQYCPVPLPAAIWLFAPVSAFLFRLSRRRTV